MAQAIRNTVNGRRPDSARNALKEWDQLPDDVRANYLREAAAAYAVVELHCILMAKP